MTVSALRRTVLVVALLNLSYFAIEFTVAQLIGSVSLFADSVDFLEDTSINLLIFVAAAWSPRARSVVGRILALVILVPTVAAFWSAIVKILSPVPPEPGALSLTALGALAVNLTCAILLMRHRNHPGSLAKAAWLSARNDALANVAILGAALLTIPLASGWPDIVVGIGIGALNATAAWEVWQTARSEREPAPAP
jgi:Co/Zn/Cd efflux system component